MKIQRWILGRGGTGTAVGDAGLALLRVVPMGLLILLHGLGKLPPSERFVGRFEGMGFPMPGFWAWSAAFAETGAALLIGIGLLTRPAAAYVVLHFLGVVFLAHAGDTLSGRELGILFGVIAATLALTGPGRYSVDGWLAARREPGSG